MFESLIENIKLDQTQTHQRSDGEALRLLAGASNLLDKCTDYEATLEMIANLLVSSLASWCAIDLVTEDCKIERAIVVHHDPAKAEAAKQILLRYHASPKATRGVYRVIQTGQSFLIPEATWGERADDNEHLRLMDELGSSSYMCVPLKARGKIVGSMMLLSGVRTYDESDLQTAQELSRYIAMAVDNVWLFRKMQEAIKVRDEFLAILSHELRTPMNVIQGWIKILKSENLRGEHLQQAIEILDRNSHIQSSMINDLLDVSRFVSGKNSFELSPVDLSKVLASSLESSLLLAEKKNIRIKTHNIPESQIILGSFNELERMFLNLLSNAIKFTAPGGEVSISLLIAEQLAVICVKDTGEGIDPKFLPFIFDSFRQENSSTTRLHGGLGLGLSISKHIVDQHGGQIRATSQGKGAGTQITVSLPIRIEANVIVGSAPKLNLDAPISASLGSQILKNINVLIVDDVEDVRFLLTRYLIKNGASVVSVSSASEAYSELQRRIPDILLSDIGMPFEDGYSLIAKIRDLPEDRGGKTKAIALTAYAREEERLKALACGFDAHLTKPVFSPILVETIRQVLNVNHNSSSEVRV